MSYDYHTDGTVTVPSWEQQNYGEFVDLPVTYRMMKSLYPLLWKEDL